MPDQLGSQTQDPLLGSSDAFALDHAAWASLTGPHARFAQIQGQAARYPPDVSPFVGLAPDHDARVWDDLSALIGPGGTVGLAGVGPPPPEGWEVVGQGEGVQMVDVGLRAE